MKGAQPGLLAVVIVIAGTFAAMAQAMLESDRATLERMLTTKTEAVDLADTTIKSTETWHSSTAKSISGR